MTDFKPKFGRLPQIPDRPALTLRTLGAAVALPVPPPEVHNVERDAADKGFYGNDTYGDCVAVAIEKNRVIAAEALGVSITKLTSAQVVANYFKMTGGPDAGLVIQLALEWARKNGWGGSKLLFFARARIAELAIHETVNEFQSCIFGLEIHASQMWPSAFWDYKGPNDPREGGHGTAGGTFWTVNDACKTWGYMATMTPSYVSNLVDEVDVLVWDFQWTSLSYDRQVSIIADLQELTGKTWTGPAPVPPVSSEVTVPSVAELFTTMPPRVADSRYGVGTLKGKLAAGESRLVPIAGLNGVPLNATGIIGNLTVTNQAAAGWVSVTPIIPTSAYSTINFPVGDNRANGFSAALVSGGVVVHNGSAAPTDFIIDLPGYYIPA